MFHVRRVLPLFIIIILFLAACDGGKKGADQEGLKEFDASSVQAEQRIETLKSQLFDSPDNLELLSALGDAYFESQRYIEAIGVYEKAIKINPKSADSLNDLALSQFYTGNSEAALVSVTKAVEADPVYKHGWLTKGFILMTLGRLDEAAVSLKKVKELDLGGRLAEEADNFLNQIDSAKDRK
ncbi:MAG: tetratricopeptide repeat protein [bacterium]|nr:tetratricopeptide repeat protein [bacterium]